MLAHQVHKRLIGVLTAQHLRQLKGHRGLRRVGTGHGEFDAADAIAAHHQQQVHRRSAHMRAQLLLQYGQQEAFRQVHPEQGVDVRVAVRLGPHRHQQRNELFWIGVRVVGQDMAEAIG